MIDPPSFSPSLTNEMLKKQSGYMSLYHRVLELELRFLPVYRIFNRIKTER